MIDILTRLKKLIVTPYNEKNKISIIKEDIYYMADAIRYIEISGGYDKFDYWEEKTRAIERY